MIVAADLQVCQKRNRPIEELTADLEGRRHVVTRTHRHATIHGGGSKTPCWIHCSAPVAMTEAMNGIADSEDIFGVARAEGHAAQARIVSRIDSIAPGAPFSRLALGRPSVAHVVPGHSEPEQAAAAVLDGPPHCFG